MERIKMKDLNEGSEVVLMGRKGGIDISELLLLLL